jgi:hypothetical protein
MADANAAVSTVRKYARLQKKNGRIINRLIILLMVISLFVLPLWGIILLFGGSLGPALSWHIPFYYYLIDILLVYGTFFIVPFLLCLPAIIPFALKQKNNGRIIVLRKFNDNVSREPLRRIVRTDLSNYGHVFTLSDKNFNIKWYIKIPLFVGQMSFFHFRQRTITSKKDIANLEKKLADKLWLNINWLLSFGKIFSIKTSDEFWKETATVLLKENSLILFDASYSTESLEWEFAEILKLGYISKIIAITNSKKLLAESKWKNIFSTQENFEIPVFYYDENGNMPEKLEFDFTVARMLARLFEEEPLRASRKNLFKNIGATVCSALLLFAFSLFFSMPYIAPDITGKFSPFGGQVITAYLHSKMHSDNDIINQRIIYNRIKQNWDTKAKTVFLNYTTNYRSFEYSAVQSVMVEFTDSSQLNRYIDLALTAAPALADSAVSIILKINPPTLKQITLQCLSSSRIDVKQRSLRLLKKISMDPDFTVMLTQTLAKSKPATEAPFEFSNEASSLLTSECNFYVELVDILSRNRYLNSELLQPLLNNSFYQLRILASFLLAEQNNTTIIKNLLYAGLIDSELNNDWLFIHNLSPYAQKADTLLLAFKNPVSLPTISTMSSLLNYCYLKSIDTTVLKALLIFVTRNYSASDLNKLVVGMPNNKINVLRNALQYCIISDSGIYYKVQQMIILLKPLLIKNIDSENINSKLRIGKLLAYTGDEYVLLLLKKAADDDAHKFFGLHSNKILEAFNILYANSSTAAQEKLFNSNDVKLIFQEAKLEWKK